MAIRGLPAKEVEWATVARVQIPPTPPSASNPNSVSDSTFSFYLGIVVKTVVNDFGVFVVKENNLADKHFD